MSAAIPVRQVRSCLGGPEVSSGIGAMALIRFGLAVTGVILVASEPFGRVTPGTYPLLAGYVLYAIVAGLLALSTQRARTHLHRYEPFLDVWWSAALISI